MLAFDAATVITPAVIALGVAVLAAYLAHVYRVRQWRFERRFDIFTEFLTAYAALTHRMSGMLPADEATPSENAWLQRR